MKRKLSPIYYIIPVVYIGVILFFVFMQFQAREEFGEKVGSLSVSGVYAKTLGGARRIRQLDMQFHDLRMQFSSSSGAIAGFGADREKKLSPESLSQFPDGFELLLSDELSLRFTVEGDLGDRVTITPIIPPQLRAMRTLSVPFDSVDGEFSAVKAIPVLAVRGPGGLIYASLNSGSKIDTENARFILDTETEGNSASIVLERVLQETDPYLYWFSRDLTLADEQRFAEKIETYLDEAYQYWNGVFVSNPGSRDLIGEFGIALISEAIKRGDYRRTLAVLSRNLRQLLAENADNPALYNSAAYLGDLPSFLAARQQSSAAEIQRITNLITAADFAVFETRRLLCFILDHAPFSLAEEVLRLADSVQLETAEVDILIHLVDVYLEAFEYLDVKEASSARIAEIIDRFIFPEIAKASGGLFLGLTSPGRLSSDPLSEVDLYDSVYLGNALIRAGEALAKDSYTAIGRMLIVSALDLADSEGFLPSRIRIQNGKVEPIGATLSPQSIYDLLPGADYIPKEIPLYAYLYPGSWVWTASRLKEVKIDDAQYRFVFSFPVGDTHYLLIQGIRPLTSMVMHGIPWKSDPEYFRYTDGWVYDESTQTLYVKLTHRLETEELVLNY
jgi:hypothetical protein